MSVAEVRSTGTASPKRDRRLWPSRLEKAFLEMDELSNDVFGCPSFFSWSDSRRYTQPLVDSFTDAQMRRKPTAEEKSRFEFTVTLWATVLWRKECCSQVAEQLRRMAAFLLEQAELGDRAVAEYPHDEDGDEGKAVH